MSGQSILSRSEVERLYDRIGRWQDTQRFYEGPALDILLSHGAFASAERIVEVGCGTGRFAEHVLESCAPTSASYSGYDLSGTMVRLARKRLDRFGDRATVCKTDGSFAFDPCDRSVDRVVATYVLDLLPENDIDAFLREAHRLLRPEGRLCLTGLTVGSGLFSRLVSRLWAAVHAVRPQWVGGCRPVRLRNCLSEERWDVIHRSVVASYGVPSEVLVASPK